MEKNSRGGLAPVEGVAGGRMSDACQVDADLMRAARVDADFEKRILLESLPNAVLGNCGSAGPSLRGHTDTAERIALNRRRDTAPVGVHFAANQREIYLLHCASRKLRCQSLISGVGSREQKNAAGPVIKPMH